VTSVGIGDVGSDRLDEIEPIWRSLFEHHLANDDEELAAIRAERQTWSGRRAGFERILRADGFLFLAEVDDHAVGYVIVEVLDGAGNWRIAGNRYANLESIAVLPDVRGAGVGTALMRGVYRRLAELDITEMTTQVVEGNDPARRFYEREGLRPWTVNYFGRVPPPS
jgi:ribosomal protein S18 acetylase RimI-like enzyme